MNIWRRGPLNKNPYYKNSFRVARIPREITQRRTIVQLIGQTKRIIAADPRAHTINGTSVTEADINVAEQVLLDPKKRIMEELLHHATEIPILDDVRQANRNVVEANTFDDSSAPPIINLHGLIYLADAIAQEFLEGMPKAEPSFGAIELDMVPPFGKMEQ